MTKKLKLVILKKEPVTKVLKKKVTQGMIVLATQELVGDEAVPVIEYLIGKQNVSEFIIAEDLDLEIHRCRNILYRCHEHQIATFKRKKDKKKGWYICYWNLNADEVPHLLEKVKREKTERLSERLEREESHQFYMCRNACARMDFEKAFEYDYHCPECHDLMNLQDNTKTIAFLKEKLEQLKAQ
jgi:transcription initiation factor TFIIE subunit alpha